MSSLPRQALLEPRLEREQFPVNLGMGRAQQSRGPGAKPGCAASPMIGGGTGLKQGFVH